MKRTLPHSYTDPPLPCLERGQPVQVLLAWRGKGPRNVLIQRPDGTRTVRPFRGLRKP